MLSIVIIAAYLVALLCNKRSLTLLFTTVCCEFIGWSPLFLWTHNYHYGMLNFIMWGVIYAIYTLLESSNKRVFVACGLMALFQLVMGMDTRNCNGYETALYNTYEYILVPIHCYILSAFISRRNIIRAMGNVTASIRGFCTNNVLNVVFWYTVVIRKKTESA